MNELRHDLTPNDAIVTVERATGSGTPHIELAAKRGVLRGKPMPDLLREELLCEIFAASVAASPNALAMMTLERRFTYREVDVQANAIARGLVSAVVGPGDVVGLWMARGPELLIAQLAIAKTGAAWLPFDADAPVERIAVCLVGRWRQGTADLAGVSRPRRRPWSRRRC